MRTLILPILVVLSSFNLAAMEDATGGYASTKREIVRLISNNPHFAFAYGMLRRAHEIEDKQFVAEATDLWIAIKQDGDDIDREDIATLAATYWESLNEAQQQRSDALGYTNRPNIWERCELKLGSTATTLLKGITICTIISSFVVVPVAAVAMAGIPGTFQSSCKNIRVEPYRSHQDSNIEGNLNLISADCLADRTCHGYIGNEIVLPDDGSSCSYLHNNNGTLVATDSPYFSPTIATTPSKECPKLEGSFERTCDSSSMTARPYVSSDKKIPNGAYCEYTMRCKTESGTDSQGKLILPVASVTCKGKLIENCNGDLVVRKGFGDDHQCDTNWKPSAKGHHKEEL